MTDQHSTDLGAELGDPITVPATAIRQMLAVLVRVILSALAGSAFVKAILGESAGELLTRDTTVQAVVGFLVLAGVTAWGALKQRKNVAVQQTLANKLPDHEAIVA
jgi:hypothetical protein